jgi:flavodoxin I
MKSVIIVYSSIGGNTELTVQKVQNLLSSSIDLTVKRVDTTNPEEFENQDCIILACPTYGQGSLETHFEKFLKSAKSQITGKKFALIGLGDSKYYPEYLTESGTIMEEYITANGGELLVPTLRIGMPPIKFIEKLVPRWTNTLIQNLQ